MKSTKAKVKFFIFVMTLGVVSGIITFHVLNKNKQETTEINAPIKENNSEQIIEKVNENHIIDILTDVEELYIECKASPDNIIEIEHSKADDIIEKIKNIKTNLILSSKEDNAKYNENIYTIHIKNKNIKIKLKDKYFIVDKATGGSDVYEADEKHIQSMIKDLEEIYVSEYSKHLRFQDVDRITVLAKDISRSWTLNKNEIESFLNTLKLKEPIVDKESINYSSIFPNYSIQLGIGETEYTIKLIDEEIIMIDSYDNKEFYKYDGGFWEYLQDNFVIEKISNSDSIAMLLNSYKVIIDDKENIFDIEDEVFYPREIARTLLSCEKSETMVTPDESELRYIMIFKLKTEEVEVNIYNNAITYRDKTFYSENIGEIIKSLMSI